MFLTSPFLLSPRLPSWPALQEAQPHPQQRGGECCLVGPPSGVLAVALHNACSDLKSCWQWPDVIQHGMSLDIPGTVSDPCLARPVCHACQCTSVSMLCWCMHFGGVHSMHSGLPESTCLWRVPIIWWATSSRQTEAWPSLPVPALTLIRLLPVGHCIILQLTAGPAPPT